MSNLSDNMAPPDHAPPAGSALDERERAVLLALAELEPGQCFYFRTIALETGLSLAAVRTAARSLAKMGLAQYARGLFTEDGEVAGSGYGCTNFGRAVAGVVAGTESGADPAAVQQSGGTNP